MKEHWCYGIFASQAAETWERYKAKANVVLRTTPRVSEHVASRGVEPKTIIATRMSRPPSTLRQKREAIRLEAAPAQGLSIEY